MKAGLRQAVRRARLPRCGLGEFLQGNSEGIVRGGISKRSLFGAFVRWDQAVTVNGAAGILGSAELGKIVMVSAPADPAFLKDVKRRKQCR